MRTPSINSRKFAISKRRKPKRLVKTNNLRQINNPIEEHVGKELSGKKLQIIEKAIEFFSRSGVADTTVEDITEALGIAKGTFYLYFKSKKSLIIDCIARLAHITIPEEAWEDIRHETDYMARHKKRLTAFLKVFPTFSGIVNLLKLSLQSNDSMLVKKAIDTFKIVIDPLRRDLHWAIRHGIAQEVDEDVVSFIQWGIGEGLGYMLTLDPRYTVEAVVEIAMDFMSKGILLCDMGKAGKSKKEHFCWEVMDRRETKIRLKNINFNEKEYFIGRLGNGELQIPVKSVTSIVLTLDGSQISSIVSLRSGERVTLKIDKTVSLSGESELGKYVIGLNHVSAISLVVTKDDEGS